MGDPAWLRHLRDYVALPSVNPMGRDDLPAEIVGERRYAEHVREQLRRLGLDAELIGPSERPSVIAEIRAPAAAGASETLLVASHLDTVPVDGMEIDPFDPRVSDGRLQGRGSCDTKAGMAAFVAALERVLRDGTLARNVVLVGEADEELGSVGARAVAEHLRDRKPDWVIATEPTSLRVVTAHKGIALARLRARGQAHHSSNPSGGANALVRLARAVLAVETLGNALADRPHPTLGPGTCSVNLAGGGQAMNIVPDDAWLVMDRRLLPGETEQSVRTEIERALEQSGVEGVEITSLRIEKPALGTPEDHPGVRACQAALRAAGLDPTPAPAAFGTDAGVFEAHGIPGVVIGPGSIEQAHTAREYVPLDEVEAMVELYVRLLTC